MKIYKQIFKKRYSVLKRFYLKKKKLHYAQNFLYLYKLNKLINRSLKENHRLKQKNSFIDTILIWSKMPKPINLLFYFFTAEKITRKNTANKKK